MLFILPQKLFSLSRYLSVCLDVLVIYRKGLIKKIKANFKFYDVIAWSTNSCNTHIAQYFEMPDFVSHVCLQWFSVSCICNNDLLDVHRSVAENLVVPLDSAVPSFDFEHISVFWTSGFESVGIVFYSLSARTLYKNNWLLLMFLLLSFMTSIYSIISIEIRLVTHFSGYKTITLHEKAMLYVLNDDFRFFAYWNITKFCRSIHFALVTLIY